MESDLFIVWPLPKFLFASDRLAGILRQERVSGLDIITCAGNFREKWSRSESRLSGVVHAGAARARA
jgi:hypothetical protein